MDLGRSPTSFDPDPPATGGSEEIRKIEER